MAGVTSRAAEIAFRASGLRWVRRARAKAARSRSPVTLRSLIVTSEGRNLRIEDFSSCVVTPLAFRVS